MMLIHVGFWILEAAFRSLLMAATVWIGIRTMRVQAVLAQKVAWVLVLLAAGTMPLIMRAPWLALDQALRIPIRSLPGNSQPQPQQSLAQTSETRLTVRSIPEGKIGTKSLILISKPSPAHVRSSVPVLSAPLQPSERVTTATELLSGSSLLIAQGAPSVSPAPVAQSAKSFWSWSRIKLMLAAIYLVIGGFLLVRTLSGVGIAFRIWRRSEPLAKGALSSLKEDAPHVRISPDLSMPVTIGSTVILPADYADWDTDKLRVVLAHEQSHVHQRDFYLQLLAALHVAVFWFSPLGWWLQRKLSELGEALSDRAGLEQASNPVSYAQILLEFAAKPRTTPLAGVAMARTSNLSSRIDRILNARRFRLAFLDGRRHAFLAAIIVPAALLAAVACIRIVPAVEAAQGQDVTPTRAKITGVTAPEPISSDVLVKAQTSGQVTGVVSGQVSASAPDQVTLVDSVQETPLTPAVAPIAPNPPVPDVEPVPAQEPVPAPEPDAVVAPEPPTPPQAGHHKFAFAYSDGDEDSFAIINGDKGGNVNINGHSGKELEKIRQKYHGNFIWFERDGKSYIITDPAILAQSQALFKGNEQLNRQMALLDMKQSELNKKMALLQPDMEKARLPGPEFEAQMKKLEAQLAELQSDKFKKLTDQMSKEISEEKLGELQEKIGDIQGQIGEIQGKIGERQGEIGEKEGALGEQMGVLGEQMGKIGEQQGKIAEEAARRLKSVFDQAIKDGRAKPVE
jgi:beta-lactamase regulating signal transducer with metallopeptidase domain